MFMNTSFLDYYKVILDKVSFDKELLAKEYKKAKRALNGSEASELEQWLRKTGLSESILYNQTAERIPFR